MGLRILCVYHDLDDDEEPEYLVRGPMDELVGHDVTVVKTLIEARIMLLFCSGFFEIVLADKDVLVDEDSGDYTVSATLILEQGGCNVKGLGVFVPSTEKTAYVAQLSDNSVVVADQNCWTFTGKRDWNKLLALVQRVVFEYVI